MDYIPHDRQREKNITMCYGFMILTIIFLSGWVYKLETEPKAQLAENFEPIVEGSILWMPTVVCDRYNNCRMGYVTNDISCEVPAEIQQAIKQTCWHDLPMYAHNK